MRSGGWAVKKYADEIDTDLHHRPMPKKTKRQKDKKTKRQKDEGERKRITNCPQATRGWGDLPFLQAFFSPSGVLLVGILAYFSLFPTFQAEEPR